MKLLVQLIAALALVCAAWPAAAQDKVRLLLDWFVNPDHAALRSGCTNSTCCRKWN